MQNDKNRKTAEKGLTEDRRRAIIYNVVRHNSEYVPIAQLDRVTGYEPVGRGFESLWARQVFRIWSTEMIPVLHL